MKNTLIILILIFQIPFLHAQKSPSSDDNDVNEWPVACKKVEIISSVDRKKQSAYFYKSKGDKPRPLIISLHTWSNGFDRQDALSWQCIDKNYNYIHPDFRGPNKTYEACGSPLVISDIDDAIGYAIKNGNVDLNNIHIIGGSGGGYATLIAYMNTKYDVKSFRSWTPISNLVDWFEESKVRKEKYSKHIAMATTGFKFENDPYYIDVEEAKKRSPIFMSTPVSQRKNSKLYIYTGVHDGYTGSVPITHSINFYNKLVKDFDKSEVEALIPDKDIIELLTYRGFSGSNKDSIGGRVIHYKKKYKEYFQIILFEGGHEMIENIALDNITE